MGDGAMVGLAENIQTDESAIFRLDGISKRYGDLVALNDVNMTVAGNEYVSLLGPSGAGKTTLLRVIAGFEKPDSGRVYFNGRDITDLPAHERGIGFVFQNFALFPHMSVLENIAFGMIEGIHAMPRAEALRRAQVMIETVGLTGLEKRNVSQVSGGQKQRVALARTLVLEPELVLLDEPLGALDANLRLRLRNELRVIRETLGVTFLHVTGSETEALAMGDRVAVMDEGHILQFDLPATVYMAPATAGVAHFLNRYNLFEGTLSDGTFTGPFGSVAVGRVQPGRLPLYGIRYDQVVVEPYCIDFPSPALSVTYLASEYMGSSIIYLFETHNGEVVEVEHHMSLGKPRTFELRAQYVLRWKSEDAIVFG